MRSAVKRLRELEKQRNDEIPPPSDLFGLFYDELNDWDKLRYFVYVYGGNRWGFTVSDFERMEVPAYHSSLHFVIEKIPGDDFLDFPELDEWEAGIDRMLRTMQ